MAIAGVLSSVSNALSSGVTGQLSGIHSKAYIGQRQTQTKHLADALKSGDLKAAQAAYDSLTALAKESGLSNPFSRKDRAAEFNAVGTALKSGDLAGAQQAFAVLRDNLQGRSSTPAQTPPGVPPDVIVSIHGGGPEIPAPAPVPKPPVPAPAPTPAPVPKPPVPAPAPAPSPTPVASPAPEKLPPVYPNSTGDGIPEIVLNLADNGKGTSNPAKEIVLNLNGGSAQGEQINIGISQTSSGEQISLSFGNSGGTKGVSGIGASSSSSSASPSVVLNLGSAPSEIDIAVSQTSAGEQIAISFGAPPKLSAVSAFTNGGGSQTSGSGINVSA